MQASSIAPSGFPVLAGAVALAAVLVAMSLLAYRRTTPPIDRGTRARLAVLRVAAFLLLVTILLDPRWIRREEREEPVRVVALVDRSASMSLPALGWGGGASRFEVAQATAASLGREVVSRGARFETVFFAKGARLAADDSVRADGQGTDLVQALDDVAHRFQGEHLAAVALVSDGIDTEEPLVRRPVPDVPVYAVGVGDTAAPEDVRVAGVDYSPIVRAPSLAVIEATIAASGGFARRVTVRLSEQGKVLYETDTLLAPSTPEAAVRVPIRIAEPGRREMELSVSVDGHDTEPDNNRRDIVIEAEKATAKVVIVDLTPGWELSFLTALIAGDPTFDCEVIISPRREAPVSGRVKRPEEFVPALADADAVVLAAVSEEFLAQAVTDAIRRFVAERGGGLLVLPGPSSLYETPLAWDRLAEILPLRKAPSLSFHLQYTSVVPGAQAAANPVTAQLVPLFSQADWQERAPLLGFYSPVAATPASEVLLAVRGRSQPALAYRTVGNGRVAALAAGPLWRWRFLADNGAVYNEFVSGLLDVLSRGEVGDRFLIVARKNVFEAGESPVLYAELFNEKMQPVTGAPVRVEVARLDAAGAETPLDHETMRRESPEAARLTAELDPLPPGRYVVRGTAALPDRTVQSKPLEITVSSTSVEFQRTHQDRAALERLARRTGGAYVTPTGAASLPDRLDLAPRRTPSVSEVVLRASTPAFLLLLVVLTTEWILRKRAGMI